MADGEFPRAPGPRENTMRPTLTRESRPAILAFGMQKTRSV